MRLEGRVSLDDKVGAVEKAVETAVDDRELDGTDGNRSAAEKGNAAGTSGI